MTYDDNWETPGWRDAAEEYRNDREKAQQKYKPNGPAHQTRFEGKAFEQIEIPTGATHIIQGLIPRDGLVVVWGPPKCGKSFQVFDMSMHVALGWKYRDRKVKQGTVAYLALEGGSGFARRVVAWRKTHLQGHKDLVPFILFDMPVNIIADHGVLIKDIAAKVPTTPSLIVIDTLNRGLAGDENNPKDMGAFIRAADAIRTAFPGCTVLLIHHCGHEGTRPRGHSSLLGAADAQIAVNKDSEGVIRCEVEFVKDGEPIEPFFSKLETVDLGSDAEGSAMSSCVVVEAETPIAGAMPQKAKTTDQQRRFLDILTEAIHEAPDEHKSTISGRPAVSREYFKMCCKSKGWFDPAAAENNNRARVSQMINALAGKRLIGASSGFIWKAQ